MLMFAAHPLKMQQKVWSFVVASQHYMVYKIMSMRKRDGKIPQFTRCKCKKKKKKKVRRIGLKCNRGEWYHWLLHMHLQSIVGYA